MSTKNYNDLWIQYFGDYTEAYCKAHGLFVAYKSDGSLRALTRSLVDYASEIINTDLSMIFGEYFRIVGNDSDVEALQEVLDLNEWDKLKYLFTLQGLVLGDTALKLGRDDDGQIRISIVSLLNDLSYRMENGEIVEWIYKWKRQKGSSNAGEYEEVIERYSKDRVVIEIDGVRKEVPNRYGEFWLFHVPNIPSMKYGSIWGESELERIGDTVDELNSTFSKISAIETIYANPKLLISGAAKTELTATDNAWFVPREASIAFLEYKGQIIPAMLQKIDRLIDYLRNKCPELILNDLGSISGYALKLKMTKLEKKIEAYRDRYFSAFKKMFSLILKMKKGPEYEPEIDIEVGPIVPADKEGLVNQMATLLELGVISRQTIAETFNIDFEEEQKRIASEAVGEA